MKKNILNEKLAKLSSKSLILIGAVAILLSGLIYLMSSSSGISSTDQKNCEAQVVQRYGSTNELIKRCSSDVGFVAMMNASTKNLSAQETAQSISAANRADLGGGFISMLFCGFFLAVGVVLLIKGILLRK